MDVGTRAAQGQHDLRPQADLGHPVLGGDLAVEAAGGARHRDAEGLAAVEEHAPVQAQAQLPRLRRLEQVPAHAPRDVRLLPQRPVRRPQHERAATLEGQRG